MEIVELTIYVIAIFLALAWAFGIRTYTKRGTGTTMATVNTTMLFFISLIMLPILELSALHFLWIYPVSVVIGMLSLSPPFSILSYPGRIFASIVCIGL
jgi:hypothetical protein